MKNKVIIKDCKHHGATEHSLSKDRVYCRKCRVAAVSKRRRKLKLLAVEYKGSSCSLCGYNRCIAALEFHHLDTHQKDFSISATGTTKSWDRIKAEIDKCVLVCSNCHREIHLKIFNNQ